MMDMLEHNVEKNNIDTQFEGEETVDREYAEKHAEITSLDENKEPREDVYPNATVNIFPESQSAFQLFRKYQKDPPLIRLDPDFQRNSIWDLRQKSELIESILMGIPLPIIYVKEDDVGAYVIVDGRQRLTTLFDFMNNEFALKGLSVLNLNGNRFNNGDGEFEVYLSQQQQSRIEDCQLALNVIKPPTPDRVTFDLFDRVNRGGTRLNNQEMRNAIYQGEATKFLNKLVKIDSFLLATEATIKSERMKDKYLVLRLVAFYLCRKKLLIDLKNEKLKLVEFKSDIEDFLSKTMIFLNSKKSKTFRDSFVIQFDNAMQNCEKVYGKGCFRLPKHSNSKTRRPINMSFFESIAFMTLELESSFEQKEKLIKNWYMKLIADENIIDEISYITSLTKTVDSNISVENRFKIVEKIINEVKNAK